MNPVLRLILTLAILWLLLSGMFKPLLLVLGVVSVALVAWLTVRLDLLEHRGQPVYFRFLRIIQYWWWLSAEIIRSNITVARTVVKKDMPINPVLRRVTATPNTEIGRVVYANSITLTPGTTAINFTPTGEILVHALQASSLDDLEKGEMANRVKRIEPVLESESQSSAPIAGRSQSGNSDDEENNNPAGRIK